jgi:type IV secretory pathway VirB2 component (pilin)
MKQLKKVFARMAFERATRMAKKLRPRKPMVVGAILSMVSVAAMAAGDFSTLTGLTDIICTISNLISGPYLYGIGIVLITIGGVAVANSESNIAKTFSVVLVGLGIASVAVPIMRDHFHMATAC